MCYLPYLHKRSIPYLRPLPFSPEMGEGALEWVGGQNKQKILLENGYPDNLIKSTIKRKLQQLNLNPVHTVKKCPVYLHIPWIGNVSMKFEKQITSAVKRCFFSVEPRVVFTTRQLLPATKRRRATFPSSKQRNLPICVPLWQSVRWSHVSALRRAIQTTHPKIDYQSSRSTHPSKPSPPW